MPTNAFVNGIAKGPQLDPSFSQSQGPWANPVYDPEASARFSAGANGVGYTQGQTAKSGDAIQNYGGIGGARWLYGNKGWGVYRTPTGTDQLLGAQQDLANKFRSSIPQTENTLYNRMGGQIQGQTDQATRQVRQNNSGRGLLYGGINAGQEGAVNASGAASMASGRSAINQGVENEANTLANQAIQTGTQIQQTQQQMQDAVYSQAMTQMNASNAAFGGLLGAGGMIAGGYLARG